MVFCHGLHRLLLDVNDIAVVLLVVHFQKMAHQTGDVFSTGTQGGHVERHDVEPVVKILAECFLRNEVEEFAVARGNHSGIHADRLGVAHPLEFSLLQHSQQFHLKLRRRGVDFIQKNRAGVRGLKATRAVGDSTGERTPHVAEEFAFQQTLGKCTAVHSYERAAAPGREFVNRLGNQFLACARFANQEHGCIRCGHLPRHRIHLPHRMARSDQSSNRGGGGIVTWMTGIAQHRREWV